MIMAIRTSCAYVGFFVFLLCITSTKFYSYKYNVTWNQMANRKPDFRCIWSVVDNKTKCKPVCDHGYFGLYGMKTCHQWLNCTDIKSIKGFEKIKTDTIGYVKKVWISKWDGYEVVVKKIRQNLNGPTSHDEFHSGVQFLQDFSNHPDVLQIVGHCNETLVTELHAMADATNLEKHLRHNKEFDNVFVRFQLCIDFVRIMTTLHSGHGGKVFAHCDAGNVNIMLQQYLLTDDFRLVISDVDSLLGFEIRDGVSQKRMCPFKSDRNYSQPFNAPEQYFNHKLKTFPYDEKIDIWKIPNICDRLLYRNSIKREVLPHLTALHKRCESSDPKGRPTALEVLKIYEYTYKILKKDSQIY
ncbi:protein O-mannose kinase isoform X2 [Magallana gigas]